MRTAKNLLFNLVRSRYLQGPVKFKTLGRELQLNRKTIRRYIAECKEIQRQYPKRIADPRFRLPVSKRTIAPSKKYLDLIAILPELVDAATTKKLMLVPLWNAYIAIYPDGYQLVRFNVHYYAWRKSNHICQFIHRRVRSISTEDMILLNKWKNGSHHKKWLRAVVILGSYQSRPVAEMMLQVDVSQATVLKWIGIFKKNGAAGMIKEHYVPNPARRERMKTKEDNIVKLVHETPHAYGINRTSWRLADLAIVYERLYGLHLGAGSIGNCLNKTGYKFTRSREVLTSPDPHFRAKVDHIKKILAHLTESEKFFSVDEFGHFAVKMRGGTSITRNGEIKTTPQLQKSKGFLIMTAALELSTNQVTHFYSREKTTAEMMKLIELLMLQYSTASKLFISWDAASWHNSKILKNWILEINSDAYRSDHQNPLVELAPLPTSAQFLNIIESVFSGLAKAVLHNSDYDSLDACKTAIDRHFAERNDHFREHPKRAGKMLWGKESVAPVFDETKNCKTRR